MEQRGGGRETSTKRKSSLSPSEHTTTSTRKSILRSTSRTSLKRTVSSAQCPPGSAAIVPLSDPSVPLSLPAFNTSAVVPDTPQRRRRKSFKEIFSLSLASKVAPSSSSSASRLGGDQSSRGDPSSSSSFATDTLHQSTSSSASTQKARRRFSIASSPSSSTHKQNSPTSPAVRKSLSTTDFKDANQDTQYIPPVPPLPAHISPEAISPIYPSFRRTSTLLACPQTPTSSGNVPSIPGSAHSATSAASSVTLSTPNDVARAGKSLFHITKSSSVPALYTSAPVAASPSSSETTLATPQTVDLRSPTSTSDDSGKQHKVQKQQLSPLLLGPCLSESLLGAASLQNEDIVEAFSAKQATAIMNYAREDVLSDDKSEDGYGSESAEGALSTESDDYGAASNMSHAMAEEESDSARDMSLARAQHQSQSQSRSTRSNSTVSSRRVGASTGTTLRVDTSLASASSNAVCRASNHIANSPSSLSPYAQSIPTRSIAMSRQDQTRSASPSSSYRRTPTPTLATYPARTPSPRTLSQGAKICLDYTLYRLRRDGSASNSTQPEKVNMVSSGGRRYPSSTRPYVSSAASTSSTSQQPGTSLQQQLRREPRNATVAKELAYICIMKKLQSRRRLTLMEEVELDGFKQIKSTWTPFSSPLQGAFILSSAGNTSTDTVNLPSRVASPPATPLSKVLSDPASTQGGSTTKVQTSANPMDAKAPPPTIATGSTGSTIATSAFVSGAFITAQQVAWQKWVSRISFEESKTCFVMQDGVAVVRPLKTKARSCLRLSDRAHAWAEAFSDQAGKSMQQSLLTVPSSFSIAAASPLLSLVRTPSPLLELPIPSSTQSQDNADTAPPVIPTTSLPQAESDIPPFMKNRIFMFGRRTTPSDSEPQTGFSVYVSSQTKPEKPVENLETNSTKISGSKGSFGHTIATKLGLRPGKNKTLSRAAKETAQHDRLISGHSGQEIEASSSASSMATTATPISTPTTSASSTCSDQTDVDSILKAQNALRPVRPERSSLRPPREERPRPSSMVRSATTQALLSPEAHSRPSSMLRNGQIARSEQHHIRPTDSLTQAQTQLMMTRSQSEQHLNAPGAVSTASKGATSLRRISLVDRPAVPERQQRRVRVVSQPASSVHSRPHSMYTDAPARGEYGARSSNRTRRPTSQLLHVPRRTSMVVAGSPAARPAEAGNSDDDELPLATLKHNTPLRPSAVSPPTGRERAETPEARPRLRFAMRSASQPRPSSMYNTPNRQSVILQEGGPAMPRPHSFANNRLSAYDMPNRPIDRSGTVEHYMKSQIRENQLKQENEATELRLRRVSEGVVW